MARAAEAADGADPDGRRRERDAIRREIARTLCREFSGSFAAEDLPYFETAARCEINDEQVDRLVEIVEGSPTGWRDRHGGEVWTMALRRDRAGRALAWELDLRAGLILLRERGLVGLGERSSTPSGSPFARLPAKADIAWQGFRQGRMWLWAGTALLGMFGVIFLVSSLALSSPLGVVGSGAMIGLGAALLGATRSRRFRSTQVYPSYAPLGVVEQAVTAGADPHLYISPEGDFLPAALGR